MKEYATAKERAMRGKPYAGNPHVRFEEGTGAPRHSGRSALLHNKKVVFVRLFFLGISFFCCFYCICRYMASDQYTYDRMDSLESCKLTFDDTNWMKIKIYSGGELPPLHYPGAVYITDSTGRKLKISGQYIKPVRFTLFLLTNSLCECTSLDSAWTDSIWRCTFPWYWRKRKMRR